MDTNLQHRLYLAAYSSVHPSAFIDKTIVNIAQALDVKIMTGMQMEALIGVDHHFPLTWAGCYDRITDVMMVRDLNTYVSDPSTAAMHEIIHATGHKTRLDRAIMRGEEYSPVSFDTEEATAQMGMRLLSTRLEISADKSATYLEEYLKMLPFADLHRAKAQSEAAFAFIMQKLQSSEISPLAKLSSSA